MFGNNAHTGRLNVRDHVAMVQWPRLTPQSSIEDFQKVMHGRWTKMAMDGHGWPWMAIAVTFPAE